MKDRYTTKDAYLSAFLCLKLDTWPEMILAESHVAFSFSRSDALYEAIAAFNEGETADIQRYTETLRRLRSKMYATKSGGL